MAVTIKNDRKIGLIVVSFLNIFISVTRICNEN